MGERERENEKGGNEREGKKRGGKEREEKDEEKKIEDKRREEAGSALAVQMMARIFPNYALQATFFFPCPFSMHC